MMEIRPTANALATIPLQENLNPIVKECIQKIAFLIDEVKLEICDTKYPLQCSIDYVLAEDPVVTQCGHLFNQNTLANWKNHHPNAVCPICRSEIVQVNPVLPVREFIQSQKQKDWVPIFKAKDATNDDSQALKGDLPKDPTELLARCKRVIPHAFPHDSTLYGLVPAVYEALNKADKARLSRLYLSVYQLQDGKIQSAIKTLEKCNFADPVLFERLKSVVQQIPKPIPDIFKILTPNLWRNHEFFKDFYPPQLKQFLDEPCTIWPPLKRRQTHLVAPIFQWIQLNKNGPLIPLTLLSLKTLHEKSQKGMALGLQTHLKIDKLLTLKNFEFLKTYSKSNQLRWGVLTKWSLGNFPNGYSIPNVLDATYILLWEYRRSGRHHSNVDGNDFVKNFICCSEASRSKRLIIGNEDHCALKIELASRDGAGENKKNICLAGYREFPLDYSEIT